MEKQKILFLISLLLLFAGFLFSKLLLPNTVIAETDDNIFGFAWSENIGWISLNCRSQEIQGERCKDTDYGVHIEDNGNFTGYAWSENIGWIDFAPADSYPQNPQYSAQVDTTTGNVSGWTRALSYDADWDGWISMSGLSPDYGVTINTGTGDFSGWAWGSDVVGWIHFTGVNYKVETSFPFNTNPVVSNLFVDQGDYCVLAFRPKFYWDFDDEDAGDFQNSYQIQIDDDSNIEDNPLIDSCPSSCGGGPPCGTCILGHTIESYPSVNPGAFDYNTTYYWGIKAWDNRGGVSDLVESQFTTIEHECPDIDFTWTPLRPSSGEFAQFCATAEAGVCASDVSKCYNALDQQISCSGNIFAWTFPAGTEFSTTTTAASENPKIKFSATGWQDVLLNINDLSVGGGACDCSITKQDVIRIFAPLPKWRETAP